MNPKWDDILEGEDDIGYRKFFEAVMGVIEELSWWDLIRLKMTLPIHEQLYKRYGKGLWDAPDSK